MLPFSPILQDIRQRRVWGYCGNSFRRRIVHLPLAHLFAQMHCLPATQRKSSTTPITSGERYLSVWRKQEQYASLSAGGGSPPYHAAANKCCRPNFYRRFTVLHSLIHAKGRPGGGKNSAACKVSKSIQCREISTPPRHNNTDWHPMPSRLQTIRPVPWLSTHRLCWLVIPRLRDPFLLDKFTSLY